MAGSEPDDDDPPPEPPLPGECCGSGCDPCILDVYEEELARWRARRERDRQQRGPMSEP